MPLGATPTDPRRVDDLIDRVERLINAVEALSLDIGRLEQQLEQLIVGQGRPRISAIPDEPAQLRALAGLLPRSWSTITDAELELLPYIVLGTSNAAARDALAREFSVIKSVDTIKDQADSIRTKLGLDAKGQIPFRYFQDLWRL